MPMRFVLVIATTETARIDGISAAGSNSQVMLHTPAGDAEIVEFGHPIRAPVVPVTPTGAPTPAIVTRAVRELCGFETLVVDAGVTKRTVTPTVTMPGTTGDDIRTPTAVAEPTAKFEAARELGEALPDDELVVGEVVPGGTTTALGVLTALGERSQVSSSLPDNPITLKRTVVDEGLSASDVAPGSLVGKPLEAVSAVGDPMQATAAGLVVGALRTGTDVTLAGGTQMSAVGALVRHWGIDASLEHATTSFVASDESASVRRLASDLDLTLTVTDPGFEHIDHPGMNAYIRGEVKEGAGMGGGLALAERFGVSMTVLRTQISQLYDDLLVDAPDDSHKAEFSPSG